MKTPKAMIVLVTLFAMTASPAAAMKVDRNQDKPCYSQQAVTLHSHMRKLWLDHVQWTRSYIVSALAGLPDQDATLKRLLRNQEDIGNAVGQYYGTNAGNQLTTLLKEHIMIAGQLVAAVKSGNQKDAVKYNQLWYKNADEMAGFLSHANPYWPKKDVKSLLDMHLKLTSDEVVFRTKKDWTADIKAYDKGADHILVLSDTLSNGIMRQFPNKF